MIVASQWKMSSSDLGPALHDVGGSFCKSARANENDRRTVSVEFSRARASRRARATRRDARTPNQKSASRPNTTRDHRLARATAHHHHRALETTTPISRASFIASRASSRAPSRASHRLGATTRRAWNSTRFSRAVGASPLARPRDARARWTIGRTQKFFDDSLRRHGARSRLRVSRRRERSRTCLRSSRGGFGKKTRHRGRRAERRRSGTRADASVRGDGAIGGYMTRITRWCRFRRARRRCRRRRRRRRRRRALAWKS